ncbi:unnamed protein product, partial [Didymodactylos carnosus]
MSNASSRVTSTTLKVFDIHTRVRYKNQRETNQLRNRINDLNTKHTAKLAKHTFARIELLVKLHELQHERAEGELMNKLFENTLKHSSATDDKQNTCKRPVSCVDNNSLSSLLLHNLNESIKLQNNSSSELMKSSAKKKESPVDLRRNQWKSKLDSSAQSSLELSSTTMSLKAHAERMNQ